MQFKFVLAMAVCALAVGCSSSDDKKGGGGGGTQNEQVTDVTNRDICKQAKTGKESIFNNGWKSDMQSKSFQSSIVAEFKQNSITLTNYCQSSQGSLAVSTESPISIQGNKISILKSSENKEGDSRLSCSISIQEGELSYDFQGPCLKITSSDGKDTLLVPATSDSMKPQPSPNQPQQPQPGFPSPGPGNGNPDPNFPGFPGGNPNPGPGLPPDQTKKDAAFKDVSEGEVLNIAIMQGEALVNRLSKGMAFIQNGRVSSMEEIDYAKPSCLIFQKSMMDLMTLKNGEKLLVSNITATIDANKTKNLQFMLGDKLSFLCNLSQGDATAEWTVRSLQDILGAAAQVSKQRK